MGGGWEEVHRHAPMTTHGRHGVPRGIHPWADAIMSKPSNMPCEPGNINLGRPHFEVQNGNFVVFCCCCSCCCCWNTTTTAQLVLRRTTAPQDVFHGRWQPEERAIHCNSRAETRLRCCPARSVDEEAIWKRLAMGVHGGRAI